MNSCKWRGIAWGYGVRLSRHRYIEQLAKRLENEKIQGGGNIYKSGKVMCLSIGARVSRKSTIILSVGARCPCISQQYESGIDQSTSIISSSFPPMVAVSSPGFST